VKLSIGKITFAVLLANVVSACSVTPDFEAENCRTVDYVKANSEQLDGSEVYLRLPQVWV
jgi:hypothetical protein